MRSAVSIAAAAPSMSRTGPPSRQSPSAQRRSRVDSGSSAAKASSAASRPNTTPGAFWVMRARARVPGGTVARVVTSPGPTSSSRARRTTSWTTSGSSGGMPGRICGWSEPPGPGTVEPMSVAVPQPSPSKLALAVRATRPPYLPTSVLPALAGALVAIGNDAADWWLLPLVLVATLLVHAGVDITNEVEDAANGVDSPDKMDNSRVFSAGLLSIAEGRRIYAAVFAVALVLGLVLCAVQTWALLPYGLAGILGGWLYTGGPRPYKYDGLGDPMIVWLMGPLLTQGAYTAITGDAFSAAAFWVGLFPGLLITAVLEGNNLSDIPGDAAAGVRTLAVRVGFRPRAPALPDLADADLRRAGRPRRGRAVRPVAPAAAGDAAAGRRRRAPGPLGARERRPGAGDARAARRADPPAGLRPAGGGHRARPPLSPRVRTAELDAWLPDPAVRTHHRRTARATPEELWSAASGVRLADTRTLGRLVRWRIPGTPARPALPRALRRLPLRPARRGRRVLRVGAVRADLDATRDYPRLADAEAFRAWDRPGTVRVLFAHWVEPDADGRSALVSEARVRPTDLRAALALRALGRPHPDVRAPDRHGAPERGRPRRAERSASVGPPTGPSPRSSPASSTRPPTPAARAGARPGRAARPVRCWRAPGSVRRSAGTGTGRTCASAAARVRLDLEPAAGRAGAQDPAAVVDGDAHRHERPDGVVELVAERDDERRGHDLHGTDAGAAAGEGDARVLAREPVALAPPPGRREAVAVAPVLLGVGGRVVEQPARAVELEAPAGAPAEHVRVPVLAERGQRRRRPDPAEGAARRPAPRVGQGDVEPRAVAEVHPDPVAVGGEDLAAVVMRGDPRPSGSAQARSATTSRSSDPDAAERAASATVPHSSPAASRLTPSSATTTRPRARSVKRQ